MNEKRINKMKEVMDLLGIKEGILYDVIDNFDESVDLLGPYMYNGESFIDSDGNTADNEIILWRLIIGEYIATPIINIPKDTCNDTKVYVRNSMDENWRPAYFAGFTGNSVYPYSVYDFGRSSFTVGNKSKNHLSYYRYCKLAYNFNKKETFL